MAFWIISPISSLRMAMSSRLHLTVHLLSMLLGALNRKSADAQYVFNSSMDGFSFFNWTHVTRRQTIYLIKRTYNTSVDIQHSLCLEALTASRDPVLHNMSAYFTVSPFAWGWSTQVALMLLNFTLDGSTNKYNLMHSTIHIKYPEEEEQPSEDEPEKDTVSSSESPQEESEEDDNKKYKLPPPQWRFLYTEENCTVVEVLPNTTTTQGHDATTLERTSDKKPHCELWSRTHRNESSCCEEFFNERCNTTHVYAVNWDYPCWELFDPSVTSSPSESSEEDDEEGGSSSEESEDDEVKEEEKEKEEKQEKKEMEEEGKKERAGEGKESATQGPPTPSSSSEK